MSNSRYKREIQILGNNIRKYRKERGLSQVDLETRTGIAQTDLSRIENSLSDIQFSTMVRIAEALLVSTIDLLQE